MTKKFKFLPILLIVLIVGALGFFLFKDAHIAVFEPAGTVAAKERNLMTITLLLSVFVVVPVFVMTFLIVWRYRAGNAKAKGREYKPNWDRQRSVEAIWWGIPCFIILILAVITWRGTHELDPYRALSSSKKPLTVQVVALQWKWLFIYPEQNVASVNYLQIPEDTPINFEITSDAPMNSFWIPRLGGQMYAMEGMSTQLHLMADQPGTYTGSSANLSGKGFADMDFLVQSSTDQDFSKWVKTVKQTSHSLTMDEYTKLAKPSEHNAHYYYSSVKTDLYGTIINKFMAHQDMSY
jgi:cytochrome o ubiquinol oxidase subunit 2